MSKLLIHDHNNDGINRRGFLQCMAWAGTGVIWTVSSGVLSSRAFGQKMKGMKGELHFVQISDSHMGFNKPANPDVTGTLQATVDKINALPQEPDFIIHTGDLSHTSKPGEYDTLDQVLKSANPKQIFFVPGEHDTSIDDGKLYLERYGKDAKGRGWYSFNHKDVHFVGLCNVAALEGLGKLGTDQLVWLEADLKSQPASRPVVVFAHIPLWSVYPEWGWGTEDSAQALGYLKRFGSVTVLNGHIHQVMQKTEGNVMFHTAMSTAFPQAAPGPANHPGPMKVADDKLRSVLGITNVQSVMKKHSLAVVDSPLAPAGSVSVPEERNNLSKPRKPYILGAVLAAFVSLVVGSSVFAAGQSTGGGKELFEKRCGGCHALDRDKEGPRLRGVYGRVAGSVDSFQYSDALKKSKITWTDETLDQWLTDTDKLVPGNDMTFHVEKAAERAEIIAYLKQTPDK